MTYCLFSIEDLYLAYRKAKADLYAEKDYLNAESLVQYETHLDRNLRALYRRLNTGKWWKSLEILGDYTYSLKDIDVKMPESQEIGFQTINPSNEAMWETAVENDKAEISYRLTALHSIQFHIISALWIMKYGEQLDFELKKSAYGSRVKRASNGMANSLAVGTFKYYYYDFNKWRKDGFSAIRVALARGQSVVALTADAKSFYHRIDPNFVNDAAFLNSIEITPNDEAIKFSKSYVKALVNWSRTTPEHRGNKQLGIPVGCSASKIIANVLLAEFDEFILSTKPIYYGRYVDDIFLVYVNDEGFANAKAVWDKLIVTKNSPIKWNSEKNSIIVNISYSPGSLVEFSGAKQRAFFLSGTSGRDLVNSIESEIMRRSSEYRLLPEIPAKAEHFARDIFSAGKEFSEPADNLRKSDGLSIRKLSFAIKLGQLESLREDFSSSVWKKHRSGFFKVVLEHAMSPISFGKFYSYIPRILGVAVAAGDWKEGAALLRKTAFAFSVLRKMEEKNVDAKIKLRYVINRFSKKCRDVIYRAVIYNTPREPSRAPSVKTALSKKRQDRDNSGQAHSSGQLSSSKARTGTREKLRTGTFFKVRQAAISLARSLCHKPPFWCCHVMNMCLNRIIFL